MVIGIESLFPGLVGKNYQATSPANDVYNCIAWAVKSVTQWWWPFDAPGHYWPAGAAKTESIPAFHDAFATVGFAVCSSEELESGFEKIAVFASDTGIPTHASRQLPNGRWTSKLGKLEDIEHDLLDLTGIEYGTVVLFMRRPQT
jgi:hypothetical protein